MVKWGPRSPKKGDMPQEKLQKQKKNLKLVYRKDILAHVYVGTPLCPNSFLSARTKNLNIN